MNAIELAGVVKDYRGLRPFRIRDLVVAEGELVTISGLDLAATEIFTGLLTATVLPDAGIVRVLGTDTSALADADGWLAALDRFGVVSDRVALLDGFTVEQNVAIPLTLDLDALPADVVRSVRSAADLTGLPTELFANPAGALPPAMRFRLRLARAVVPSPRILVVEHPSASVPASDLRSAASTVRGVVRERRMTAVVISEDVECRRISDRYLTLEPATGVLKGSGLRRWFS